MEAWRFGGFGKQQGSLGESVRVRWRGGERVGAVKETQWEHRRSQRETEGGSREPQGARRSQREPEGARGKTTTRTYRHPGGPKGVSSGIPKAPQTSKANRSRLYFSNRKRSPKEVRYMESVFGTEVPLLHCSFFLFPRFCLASFVGLLIINEHVWLLPQKMCSKTLARTPAEDIGTLQTSYERHGGRVEGKDVGEEMASTMGSSAWEASHFGRGPFRRDAKQGSGC